MSTEFNVNAKIQDLPIYGFTLNNIYKAIAQNLYGTIDETILPSFSNQDASRSSFSPWLDGLSWKVFDSNIHGYRPTTVAVSNISLASEATANRVQLLQNKDGVWALLDDTYNMRPVVTLQEGLVNVDWDIGSNFQVTLSGNRQSAFYMTHSRAGMEIDLLVTNSGTNQTASFDPAIVWQGGSAPTMLASMPGASKSILITIRNINGTMYGEISNYEHSPVNSMALSKASASLKTGGVMNHD